MDTSLSRSFTRAVRVVLLSLLAVVLTMTMGQPAGAQPASQSPPAFSASGQYLIAADPAAGAVYVYRASDLQRTGQLNEIGLSSHGGTVQLPDGRLLYIDDTHGTIGAIRVDAAGRPRVVNSVRIPGESWAGAAWAATDAKQRYFAVSGVEEGDTRSVSIVDLKTFAIRQVHLPARPDSTGDVPETQVYLAGTPLQLVITTGGRFKTYPLGPILKGMTPRPSSTAPVGPYTHGPVISRDGRQVFSTTADGFDGATLAGATLTRPRSVAYSATRDIVQMWRPRLARDGRHVWGSVAEDTGLTPADWIDTRNDVNIIDTSQFTSTLVRVPDGIISRLALSSKFAAVTTIHPDGDALTLLDANPSSPTYRRIIGTVAVSASTDGPIAGQSSEDAEGHFLTLTPNGETAYVTNGGDGRITAVDTKTRRVTRSIRTPTPLHEGGYLTVIQSGGKPLTDLIAR